MKILLTVFKAKHLMLPVTLQKYFSDLNSIHMHNTRSSSKGNFHVFSSRTSLKSKCISVNGVKLWNSLDINIRNISSIVSFKNKLKRKFIDQYKNCSS